MHCTSGGSRRAGPPVPEAWVIGRAPTTGLDDLDDETGQAPAGAMAGGPARPPDHAAANPGRPAQLSPAARRNVWAMIWYPAWLACWLGPRGGAAHAHVHWQITATLRGTLPIPGTVT